nr:hypothetical protein LTR18_002324 [Exophiala xenobiotica]
MAITRHTQMRNARVLRSRRVAVTPVDRRSRPSRRDHDRLSTISRRSKSKQECHSKHSDGLKEIHVGTSPELIEVGNLLHEQLTPSVEGADDGEAHDSIMSDAGSSAAPPGVWASSSPVVDQFAAMAPFADTISTFEGAALPDSVMGAPSVPSISPEDIGLPSDGIWDYHAAYEQRFCYDHGELEYLLETANRWISSNDLGIPGAEVKLENLLQKDKVGPAVFNPYARRCQAECHASLYAQIYSIMEKREDATSTLYLAKFRAFWTPGSNIDDQGLLAASLGCNQQRHCRRSLGWLKL